MKAKVGPGYERVLFVIHAFFVVLFLAFVSIIARNFRKQKRYANDDNGFGFFVS